jgi:hypothetical protein
LRAGGVIAPGRDEHAGREQARRGERTRRRRQLWRNVGNDGDAGALAQHERVLVRRRRQRHDLLRRVPAFVGRERDRLRDFRSDDDRDVGGAGIVGRDRIERAIADRHDDGRAWRRRDRHARVRGERHRRPGHDATVGVERGDDGATRTMLGRQPPARVMRVDRVDLAGVGDECDRARRQLHVDRVEIAEHDTSRQIERAGTCGAGGREHGRNDDRPHFHCTFASTCGPRATA